MPEDPAKIKPWRMTPIEWLICGIAAVGFAFDTFTLLVLTLIVRPALTELLPRHTSQAIFDHWVGVLFYVPAIAGGIFGLLGGYLIDRLGRRRILLWSILLYAFSTCAMAYVTTPMQFLLFRCGTFAGVSVEFVAATAWLAELFTRREQRETVIGYTQGFASTGGVLVSGAYYLTVTFSRHLPTIYGAHQAWRYTAISGLLPAIPLLLVPLVLFLPAVRDVDMSTWGIFALGLLTVGQFTYWGNYLPLVYPTYLRGTGESFAANIGGRMLGTSAALLVTSMVVYMPGGTPSRELAYASGIVGFLSYAVGFAASFWLPEPSQDVTPE